MKSRFIVISGALLATAAIAALLVMRVRAQEDSYREGGKSRGQISGTLVSAAFDFDHPDLSTPANIATFTGSDSRFGRISGQYLGEFVPDGQTCTPPSGVAGTGTEFVLLTETGVVTRDKTGEQLFFTATSGKQCTDLSAGLPFAFDLSKTDTITGGTGEFAGATGPLTTEGRGAILAIDASTHRVFGWGQIKYDAEINLP